jgi:hypothetical protein
LGKALRGDGNKISICRKAVPWPGHAVISAIVEHEQTATEHSAKLHFEVICTHPASASQLQLQT